MPHDRGAEGRQPEDGESPRRRRRWVTAVKVLLAVVALWYFSRLVRRVDWPHVGESLARLSGWQVAVLVALTLLRQVLTSTPLALYVPGLRLRRALVNDLSATVVATVAPPPADIAVRMTMFRSWGIASSSGASGLTLNAFAYYVARFSAPMAGLVLALVTGLSAPGTHGPPCPAARSPRPSPSPSGPSRAGSRSPRPWDAGRAGSPTG